MAEENAWDTIAESCGFSTEVEMWKELYEKRSLSMERLSAMLGFGINTIHRRLKRSGVTPRKRGGPRNVGNAKWKLLRVDPRLIAESQAGEIARLANVSISVVWHFKQWMTANVAMYE